MENGKAALGRGTGDTACAKAQGEGGIWPCPVVFANAIQLSWNTPIHPSKPYLDFLFPVTMNDHLPFVHLSSTSCFLSWVSPLPLNIPIIVSYSLVFLNSWYLYCRCSFFFFFLAFSSTERFSRVFTFVLDMGEKIRVWGLIWSIAIPSPLNGWESESYPKLFRDYSRFGSGTELTQSNCTGRFVE